MRGPAVVHNDLDIQLTLCRPPTLATDPKKPALLPAYKITSFRVYEVYTRAELPPPGEEAFARYARDHEAVFVDPRAPFFRRVIAAHFRLPPRRGAFCKVVPK